MESSSFSSSKNDRFGAIRESLNLNQNMGCSQGVDVDTIESKNESGTEVDHHQLQPSFTGVEDEQYTNEMDDETFYALVQAPLEARANGLDLSKLADSCEYLGDLRVVKLAVSLEGNQYIRNINLSSNKVKDNGACALAKALDHRSKLHTLILSSNLIGNEGLAALGAALPRNQNLKELDLEDNCMTYLGLEIFAKGLRTNFCLAKLNLSSNNLSDDGACTLAWHLRINSSLRSLNLSLNRLTDIGASAIGDMLSRNSGLAVLDLSGNQIESLGCSRIASGLVSHQCVLEFLDLSSNFIGDDGALSLSDMLLCNGSLQHLDVCFNGISELASDALHNAVRDSGVLKRQVLTELAASSYEEDEHSDDSM